jgi:cytochrome c biogenesis protein CcmG/thiol:disulfide interchange protein DsbE
MRIPGLGSLRSSAWRLLLALVLSMSAVLARAEPPAALGEITGRVVMVDFWASWCTPCRRSFPWMNAMHRKYAADGLQIIAVNVDKERELAEAFLSETPAEFGLRYDPAGALATVFGVQAMPSSFLLDSSGAILAKHYGFRTADADEYEQRIRAALDARSEDTK